MHRSPFRYKVSHRDIKYPRIELKTGRLHLILPHGYNPVDLIEKHTAWITGKTEFVRNCLRDSKKIRLADRTERDFRNLIAGLVDKFSKELSVSVGHVYFRKMRTKWASCSARRNLTINSLMIGIPRNLIEYIIYHELTHLKEKRHNDRFWQLVSKRFKSYEELEASLFPYWFVVNTSLAGRASEPGNRR